MDIQDITIFIPTQPNPKSHSLSRTTCRECDEKSINFQLQLLLTKPLTYLQSSKHFWAFKTEVLSSGSHFSETILSCSVAKFKHKFVVLHDTSKCETSQNVKKRSYDRKGNRVWLTDVLKAPFKRLFTGDLIVIIR